MYLLGVLKTMRSFYTEYFHGLQKPFWMIVWSEFSVFLRCSNDPKIVVCNRDVKCTIHTVNNTLVKHLYFKFSIIEFEENLFSFMIDAALYQLIQLDLAPSELKGKFYVPSQQIQWPTFRKCLVSFCVFQLQIFSFFTLAVLYKFLISKQPKPSGTYINHKSVSFQFKLPLVAKLCIIFKPLLSNSCSESTLEDSPSQGPNCHSKIPSKCQVTTFCKSFYCSVIIQNYYQI